MPGQSGKYVCLSHCWGKTPITCCTTIDTVGKAMDFLDYGALPRNFQDAITITRRLDIQYIWIDSVCIIQDDKYDWEVESAKMADIYRYSYLTIAAASSADSTGGCFSSTNADICMSLDDNTGRLLLVGARMCDAMGTVNDEAEVKKRFPLFQRGWVLQERLMSRRILYCNYGELAFECLESKTCECGNSSLSPHVINGMGKREANLRHRLLMAKVSVPRGDLSLEWRSMVSSYTLLHLTKANDILPAISGCARVISELTGDEYLAGMWKKSLSIELLWYIETKRKFSRAAWTAPSWSWASISPGQEIFFLKPNLSSPWRTMLGESIQTVDCKTEGGNDLGQLVPGTGRLTLKSALLPCFVRRFCNESATAAQPSHDRRRFGLHYRVTIANPAAACEVPVPALESQDGQFVFYPDVRLGDELWFDPFPACSICSLARIWLLHIARKVDGGECRDIFMMLKEIEASPNTYGRFGVTKFEGHTVGQRGRWFKEVWEKQAMPKRDFSIV
ncbi:HET-domain-containing protein [Mytilinidion resinicola]|uniref:HET-domain-containing protein n=1 Tax=Mytilinidion resinicola TaxID=574789 RepID=A0A6A6YPM2_9PEZI|nr:HET-domain-containing protein [Mytilinidion resinicola]KAF2809817.1 HET-domain-containing protein [Mytilinidion resinicola]